MLFAEYPIVGENFDRSYKFVKVANQEHHQAARRSWVL
jgi:hypothetical protein